MLKALVNVFLFCIGRTPFFLLYIISDALFVLLYYIVRYRRKIVAENLAFAFPELSEVERGRIAKNYFRNLCDMILETLKMRFMKWEAIEKRFIGDASELNRLYAEEKSVLLCIPHQFNWEWGGWWLNHKTKFKINAVYQPLSNTIADDIFRQIRGKYGTFLIALGETGVKESKAAQTLTALLADQTPVNLPKARWTFFFHRPAPFHNGFERIARITGQIPVFIETEKYARGYYRVKYIVPFENPHETRPGEITDAFARFVENAVRRSPDTWLWSHRRWKRAHLCPEKEKERLGIENASQNKN